MRLSPQNVGVCVIFAVLSLVGVCGLFSSHLLKPLRIFNTAVTTEATLDDSYTERTSRRSGDKSYSVAYTFTVNGTEYRGSSGIGVEPTKTMPVFYVPSDPTINDLDLKGHATIDITIYGVMAATFLGTLAALAWHFGSPPTVAAPKVARANPHRRR